MALPCKVYSTILHILFETGSTGLFSLVLESWSQSKREVIFWPIIIINHTPWVKIGDSQHWKHIYSVPIVLSFM